MRILITGISGFAGKHLAEWAACQKNVQVHGFVRPDSDTESLKTVKNKILFHTGQIEDSKKVHEVLKKIKPDRIFHLAAQSFVPDAERLAGATLRTNIIGTLNILEVVRALRLRPRIHIASSSEVYGSTAASKSSITEETALSPLNLYGVSKAAQDFLGGDYSKTCGLWVVRTRAFNHTGPGQRESFVASSFAKQVALIERGKKPPFIEVGNLKAVRDFTDVRDVVRGYWLALEKGKPGEVYNICSGSGHPIQEILDIYSKYSNVRFRVEKDPKKLRRLDIPRFVGSASKFKARTGWKPEIPLEKTLLDLLNDWRAKVRVAGITG